MPSIKTVQVIEHYKNLETTEGGMSFGQHIDMAIAQAFENGQSCQEFAVLFDREEWAKMEREYHHGPAKAKR